MLRFIWVFRSNFFYENKNAFFSNRIGFPGNSPKQAQVTKLQLELFIITEILPEKVAFSVLDSVLAYTQI